MTDYPPTKTPPWQHQKNLWPKVKGKSAYYVAWDMGCVTADTVVNMNRAKNGRKVTVAHLYELFHGINRTKRFRKEIPIYIRALCDGEFRQHLVKTVLYKGPRQVLEITTATGKTLTLTPDHEIAQADNKWTAAENLIPGSKILLNGQPVYRKTIDQDGYVRLNGRSDHPRANSAGQVYEHIVVMEKYLGREVPRNELIHHIDGNPQNNEIENLELTTNKIHHCFHRKFRNLDGGSTINGGKVIIVPKEDTITSIKNAGIQETYDIVMSDPHRNFVANSIVVHNCGKSKAGVDLANTIGDSKRILIVCPSKVVPVWPGQFERHSYADFCIYANQKGTCKQKATEIEKFLTRCEQMGKSAVVILNYEAIIRPPLAPIYAEKSKRILHKGLLLSYIWDLLICDEAHRIKAPNGKASWQVARIARKSRRRLFLSGTPMPHSPSDIYAQYRALDPNIFGTSYTRFRARYCVMGGFEARQVIGYQNLDELQAKFYSIADYVKADDVLDLPDKIDRILTCQLGPKARKIYNDLESDFIADVQGGVITVQNALDKLLRLAQIAGGFLVYEEDAAEDDNARSIDSSITTKRAATTDKPLKRQRIIDNAKIELVIETLKDLPADEPIVIFCRFLNEIDRLREAIEKEFKGTKENLYKDKRTVCEISGRVKVPIDFKDGVWQARKTNTVIAQIQAACEGIDLTAARYNFYFSMGFSLGQYRQSRKRTRRPGQTRKVFYYHIIAQGTVDRKIMRAIEEKREIVNSVLEQTKHGTFVKNAQHDAVKTALGIFNS